MNAIDVIERVVNSENGGLYAVIGGNLLAFSIDRIMKSRYTVNAKKKTLSIAPATQQEKTEEQQAELKEPEG